MYNLAVKADHRTVFDLRDTYRSQGGGGPKAAPFKKLSKDSDLLHFLETGKCEVVKGTAAVLSSGFTASVVCERDASKNAFNILFDGRNQQQGSTTWPDTEGKPNVPLAVIVPIKVKGYKLPIVANADEEDDKNYIENLVCCLPPNTFPSMSFECVRRLMGVKTIGAVALALAKGDLVVVDYEVDCVKKLTPKQRKLVNKGKKVRGPLGYTLIYQDSKQVWHRAATVVLADRKNEKVYLVGQDEGSYFGCVLQSTSVKTVAEAYKDLMPPEAVGVAGVLRQGEWFAIPINERDVPKPTDCIAWGQSVTDLCLPIDHADSNAHELGGEVRIAKNGRIYARHIDLNHQEHNGLYTSEDAGWYFFARNTALQSVSVGGVD